MRRKHSISERRRPFNIVLIAFVAICVFFIGGYLLLHVYINKMNLVKNASGPDTDLQQSVTEETASETLDSQEEDSNLPDSPEDKINSLEEEIRKNMEKNSTPISYDKDVFQVLLIGSDNRDIEGSGRSDAMILVSVNKKSKKIVATSFLRDIYLKIPGKNSNRLNAAYAYGGAELLMDTIGQNFKIELNKYASIDFYSFINVVDAVGGVTLEVTKEDIPVINDYVRELNKLTDQEEEKDVLTSPGTLLLNGKQALAYSRNRYVGNGDFSRTEKQRQVLEQIFEKVKGLNLLELKDLFDVVLPDVTTNLSEGELFSMILSLPSYMNYDLEQWSIPVSGSYDSLRIRGMAVLGIDFDKNIKEIRKRIYGEEE